MSVVVSSAVSVAEPLLCKENVSELHIDCGTVERRRCCSSGAAVTDQLGLEVNARPGASTDISVRRDNVSRKSEIVIGPMVDLRVLNTRGHVP